jgi:hypothetical protein
LKTKFLIIITLVLLLQLLLVAEDDKTGRKINYQLSLEDEIFLDTLQYYSFLYFINEINPENGLVRDRTQPESPASMAATGFALPIWAIGAERGWISRDRAKQLTLNLLKFLWTAEQSDRDSATGYKGFFYHFVDIKTGKRMWDCELSSIDTGLLLAGIHFAIQFYNKMNDETETQIRNLGDKITQRVEWDFLTMPSTGKFKNTISLSWEPETGLNPIGWIGYNEALIMYLLAASLDYSKIDLAYNQWLYNYEWREPYLGLAHALFPPLFGHQYSHLFIDFRGLSDSYLKEKGIDYFENSRRAVLTQQLYAIENPLGWKGYDSLCWGLTACDGPGNIYNYDDKKFEYYNARGTSGKEVIQNDDGTIAPTAAGGSIVFAPEIVIPTLKSMYQKYGDKGLWGKYGFVDSFNPTLNWFNKDYLGIDQGPFVIMIENLRTGLVWNNVMKDPLIQKGLKRLGFVE